MLPVRLSPRPVCYIPHMHAKGRTRSLTILAAGAALALVAWFAWRGERFIAANGPTFDEVAHLTAGYAYWKAGEFRLNNEDPPLLKLLWSLPLLFTDAPPYPPDVAPERRANLWQVSDAWAYDSGVPLRSLLDPARRVNLALGCGVVLLAGWWAFRLWDSRVAGVGASAFAAATSCGYGGRSPNMSGAAQSSFSSGGSSRLRRKLPVVQYE